MGTDGFDRNALSSFGFLCPAALLKREFGHINLSLNAVRCCITWFDNVAHCGEGICTRILIKGRFLSNIYRALG